MTKIQYAAIYEESGDPVQCYHQDDSENPMVCNSLEGLFNLFSDWCDMGIKDSLDLMQDYEGNRIIFVRQEVKNVPLTPDDLAIIKKAKKEE